MENTVILLYSLLPFVSSSAYLPQVRKILTSSAEEVKSVSLGAWSLWLGCSIVTLLYGTIHLHDTLFCFVASVNTFWCALVIGITLYKTATFDTEVVQPFFVKKREKHHR